MSENISNVQGAERDYHSGWERDTDDEQDYSIDDWDAVVQSKDNTIYICGSRMEEDATKRSSVDWSESAGTVSDQANRNCCVQEAACNAIMMHDLASGSINVLPRSVPFLWKVTRNLSGTRGNVGTRPRDVMKALAVYGVPPMNFWNRGNGIDVEPGAFVYGRADNLVVREYRRLDLKGRSKDQVLSSLKQMIAQGIPVIGGYYSFELASMQSVTGNVLYAEPQPVQGRPFGRMPRIHYSHCIMFCGYDDQRLLATLTAPKNTLTPAISKGTTSGAFKFKNSWGTGWGEEGFGWLPYEFLLHNLCFDLWALMDVEMLHIEPFKAQGVL